MINIQLTKGNVGKLSERELLTQLRRNIQLFSDPAVRGTMPYQRRALAENIKNLIDEARSRGWVPEVSDGVFTLRANDVVELCHPNGMIEVVDGPTLQQRVYFRLSDRWAAAKLHGDILNVQLYLKAMVFLLKLWGVRQIHSTQRRLVFREDTSEET